MRTDLPETGSVSGLVRQCFRRSAGDYEQREIFQTVPVRRLLRRRP